MAKRPIVSNKVVERSIGTRMYKRELEKYNICTQASVSFQTLPPFYEIEAVTFDPETRAAAITFLVSKVKGMATYPVAVTPKLRNYMHDYNETVERELRAITLTNEVLENLTRHHDELIARFAIDIVGTIKNADIYPSWFVEEIATGDLNFEVEKAYKGIEFFKRALKEGEKDLCAQIEAQSDFIGRAEAAKRENERVIFESGELCGNMLQNPGAYFKFPLFAKMRARKKIEALQLQIDSLKSALVDLSKKISEAEEKKQKLRQDMQELLWSYEEAIEKENAKIEKARARYQRIMNSIIPLA